MTNDFPDRASVFVVDDDEGVRNALSRIFRREGLRVEVFASAEEFLCAYRPGGPGCLLLDVKMPGMSGLELQAVLATHRIVLPVIVMTGAADVAMAVQAMKAGAMDFIEKPFETSSLLASVRAAIGRDARQRQATDRYNEAAQKYALLTARERAVFDLVVQDNSCKEIAGVLGISHRTVETHRSRILAKMDAESVIELVWLAEGIGSKTPIEPREGQNK